MAEFRQGVVNYFRKLGALLGAGVPFAEALDTFGLDPNLGFIGEVAKRCAENIREGRSFSETLAEYPETFNSQVIQFIAGAEKSGTMDTALKHLAELIDRGVFPMATADRDSSFEMGLGPAPAGAAPVDAASGRAVAIWIDGDVLACACPDCGAPMSIRLWLMVADCWRCGTSPPSCPPRFT